MPIESWMPIGFELPDGASCGRPVFTGLNWQIVETGGGGRALIAKEDLFNRWLALCLVDVGDFHTVAFGTECYRQVSCRPSQKLFPLSNCSAPSSISEAHAFATALRETRGIDPDSSLQDAVYIEKLSRLLPVHEGSSSADDETLLGYWLTGGIHVPARSIRRLPHMLRWIDADELRAIVVTAGFDINDDPVIAPTGVSNALGPSEYATNVVDGSDVLGRLEKFGSGVDSGNAFELPGRAQLETFFNEHIVDIVRNKERYKALGISFPSATILHGPPGCGKTFAVEQLIKYLEWPSFEIDASTIASPYIHETSRKVSEIFEKAMQCAPSVLVIDEMEAFLADRESGGGGSHHRVEEVAEFLRRIPEAISNEVLIIAMTNRVEMIDPAILRRGRFDHLIEVGYPSEEEVAALLDKLLAPLPKDETVTTAQLSRALAGRPLSDVAFVVREGARLSARAGQHALGQGFLIAALEASPSRTEGDSGRRIGFV